MDPITHGLIGASAAQSSTIKEKLRPAALIGCTSALLPDLDVLISSSSDPLLKLEYHRQFTHAFLFIPLGALIAAGVLWWFFRDRLSFKETYLFSLLGYATAGLADAFTSYGVQLLWPFNTGRFAWNIISVFDPLFSLGLVLATGLAIYHKKKTWVWLGLAWMGLYLLFGLFQRERSRTAALELARERGHHIQQLIVKPTIANQLLWSIRYVSGDRLYADGLRLSPFAKPNVYEGASIELLPYHKKYANLEGTTVFRDIQRFATLSGNILVAHPDHSNVIGDGRYSMLPTSVRPLWGIEVNTRSPGQPVDFRTFRNADAKVRRTFLNMLMGRETP
ncbi:metal-dependent hydrolase [Fodinibius sediminis]|uniref:Inner membrane protein n=1 Tax=Fodinibius sediminis TaxID=1214077 RepID=A0A521EME6_9BACT|nr:metal-dependent hydrolase [Fodinibius sediminis]SMO85105.1 inner membrane protein [Fodinibius sediminis]